MVLAQSLYKHELQQMITEVEQKSYQAYVQKYVSYPQINLLQLHLSYLFLTSLNVSEQKKKSIVMSQMFIQLGLDTHYDLPVSAQVDLDQEQITTSQLTVLAGDYFSSHYYLFLAERQEVELIAKWAEVIQKVNEIKMDIHADQENFSPEEYFEKWCEIQSIFSASVLAWYEADESWFTINRILTRLLEGMKHRGYKDGQMEQWLAEADQTIRGFSSSVLQDELKIWLDDVRHHQLVVEP